MKYVPFLKFKTNEVSAIKTLDDAIKSSLTPFFDIPRQEDLTEQKLKKRIDAAYRKYELHLTSLKHFYLDNFDIDDCIKIDGSDNYKYIIKKFTNSKFIPVVGIDRSPERIQTVIDSHNNGILKSDTVAIRLSEGDLLSWALIKNDFNDLMFECSKCFHKFHLILDNGVCNDIDPNERCSKIETLLNNIHKYFSFDFIIHTGSTIPSSIRDLVEPGKSGIFIRNEKAIYDLIKEHFDNIIYGDYTIVSPLYSDVDLPKEILRSIMAPKIVYTLSDQIYVARGSAIDRHPRGSKQYNDICKVLISKRFYRGAPYSWGDQYIDDKANNLGKDASPSTILKPLINAHITYIINNL